MPPALAWHSSAKTKTEVLYPIVYQFEANVLKNMVRGYAFSFHAHRKKYKATNCYSIHLPYTLEKVRVSANRCYLRRMPSKFFKCELCIEVP